MKEQLIALYTLQQQDSALDALKRQFALLDPGRQEKATFEVAEAAHKAADAAMHATSGELKDVELEQKAIEIKRGEYETKLYSGKVSNPKELQAMQDEIDMLGRQRVRLDEKLLILMDALEARRKEAAEAKKAWSAARSTLKQRQEVYKQTAEQIRAQAQLLVNQRSERTAAVPPALLKRYEAMRLTKTGVAIATIEDNNACSACRMVLPSSLVTRIHEGSTIEICQNCGRMLCETPK